MSDRFAFGNNLQHYQQHSRCALCLSGDDRNPQNANIACNHGASIESALHYLRNYGAPLSPTYGGSAPSYYDSMNNGVSTRQPYAGYGAAETTSPTAAGPSNYYTLTEFLLRMNRMQRESNGGGGGHHYRPPPPPPPHPSSRHTKPKSEVGCLRECAFCKSNGETAEFYKSHFLKDPVGRVRCPILQRYQCPFCYATGENAHTRRYCPKNPNKLCFMKGGEQVVIKQNLQ